MNGVPVARRRPNQLPLGVTLRHPRGFSNFIAGPNAGAVAVLRDLLAGRGGVVYLWGGSGSGKSHLLEACCGDASLHGRPVAYLPLAGSRVEPDMLNGLAGIELLCIDDVDSVAGDGAWEEALFHLYNQAEQASCPMVLTASVAPRTPAWKLPDLASRLTAAVVWRLHALDDTDCRAALQLHARERGFELSDDVVTFVMKRLRRDMLSLSTFLDRLDQSSLAAQRRVT
ncbi:MAG: DnaA regulatory inactivator Hda, partial [Gammaproteobacteria bacterium]